MRIVGREQPAISRVAVIGAGAMGGGIAAQFANAGVPVELLDMAGPEGARNAAAEAGLARQLKVGGFMTPQAAANIRCGNVEDDLDRLADVDWIVEAIVEKLEVKHALYREVEQVRRPGTILSSNTSTIPRADLIAGMGGGMARDFIITHFFNPPRVMQLVEIVGGSEVDGAILARANAAVRTLLGKTAVDCRDTPGFIANRIGCFWLAVAALEARRRQLDIETADAINAAFGVPRTGVFGLLDLIGIDLVPTVWGSLMTTLPASDAIHQYDLPGDSLIRDLVATGRLGRKAGSGFYRKAADGSREALDLATGVYRPQKPAPDLPGGGRDLAALLADDGPIGDYANAVLCRLVAYAATHAPELAADVAAIDTAIELGYSWRTGPFGLADRAGVDSLAARMAAEGIAVPPLLSRAAGRGFFNGNEILATNGERIPSRLPAPLSAAPVLAGNKVATLHDLGDGVACFTLHTKMNSFHPGVFDTLETAIERAGRDFRALVLGNEDPRAFSVGADLAFFLAMIEKGGTDALDTYIARGQKTFLALRRMPVPVVAAAHGFALGGGCEFLLHADAVVAHAELKAGLPEVKVGLIPGWGGCTTLLKRATEMKVGPGGPVQSARRAFETIFNGAISGSALEAREAGLLRDGDEIAMYRGDLISAAKARALTMLAEGYTPPDAALVPVAGPSGRLGLLSALSLEEQAGRISATDYAMAEVLAGILTGGAEGDPARPMTEEDLMALERAAVLDLVGRPETRARMEHMLATGKPLRN